MDALALVVGSFCCYLLAYRLYGRYLGRRIFELAADRVLPSQRFEDGRDFVPTRWDILFGHHFTTIAGTGPIVGPAIGIIWGWLPAMLWILIGSIFMGAVHDMGALVISMRNDGLSIGEICSRLISPRARWLFLAVIFFLITIVLAVFALVIATLFGMFPRSVLAVWLQIPIAVWLGREIYVRRKKPGRMTIVAVVLLYVTVVAGAYLPLSISRLVGETHQILAWGVILLLYAYVASVVPVGRLLQPRDYINGYQLLLAMALLLAGVAVAHPPLAAPPLRMNPPGAPPIFPFLYVVIACGAISGFHSLAASGTTSKQISRETDALRIGYGGMLTEAALATLVVAAVAAGIGDRSAWLKHYADWGAAQGLGAKVAAFVSGSSNLLSGLGIPRSIGIALVGVLLASFAGTTMDSATRIQRYVIAEVGRGSGIRFLTNRHWGTAIAIGAAGLLAFHDGAGMGGLVLWPLFGAANQLLAGLALLVLALYLRRSGKPTFLAVAPMVFMIAMTGWAMVANLKTFVLGGDWLLTAIGTVILGLQIWIVLEALQSLLKRGVDHRNDAGSA
jgi:carbon starvation protein